MHENAPREAMYHSSYIVLTISSIGCQSVARHASNIGPITTMLYIYVYIYIVIIYVLYMYIYIVIVIYTALLPKSHNAHSNAN